MAHYHLCLTSSYAADYFAAGGGDGAVATVVDGEDGDHHIYGHHQPGTEAFVPAEMAAHSSKQTAFGGGHFVDLGEHHRQHLGRNHATTTTLTSLSLLGTADAPASSSSSSLLMHQHFGGVGARRRHYWRQKQQGPRGSRFLLPMQQLLQEFCSLPVETAATSAAAAASKAPLPANEDGSGGSSSSSARIQAMDAAKLHRLKAKLYTMLDEVDRRYRRYREQMRAVAGSFEAVAGAQAAAAYTRLASRTISRHFRALRDGVVAQVEAVRRALGDKDTAAPGGSRETTTPRLRALDQCLRQNRALQTGGMLDSQPWRPQRGLPERAVSVLRAWLFEHFLHPYPSDVDKRILAHQTGLSRSQVSNWFINARVRLWKPMVEEMYAEEVTTKDLAGCSNANVSLGEPDPCGAYTSIMGPGQAKGDEEDDGSGGGDLKPTREQLMVVHDDHDAGSLASVVSIGSRDQRNLNFGVTTTTDHLGFGAFDVAEHGQGFVGGGVSLTLGLQHVVADPHGGVNVAFAPDPTAAHSEFLFMAGGAEQQHMGGGGGVFSGGHHFGTSMDGETGMRITAAKANAHHQRVSATGFQLLHDLAG